VGSPDHNNEEHLEIPLTAEQILEHIRAHRRENSIDGSSNKEFQEFSASDFSSYTPMRQRPGTITNYNGP